MPVYLSPPPANPLARLVAAVVATLAMAAAFMIGLLAFAVVGAIVLVFGAVAWFRSRHLRRQWREAAERAQAAQAHGETIEAEYTVVSRDSTPPDPRG